jgi:hypothetical protein
MDKLEIVVGSGKRLTSQVESICDELRAERPAIPYKKSRYCAAVLDMRILMDENCDALLHYQSRNKGDHKIEILHAGMKGWDEQMTIAARITEENPDELAVRRVDLCADTPDVSVGWYAGSVRQEYKRWQRLVGHVELRASDGQEVSFDEMGRRTLETIYLGRQPNPTRIYDKVAETQHRYEVAERRHYRESAQLVGGTCADNARISTDRGGREYRKKISQRLLGAAQRMYPFVDFEEWARLHGIPGYKTGAVLTRVERQMTTSLPTTLKKVKSLRSNLIDFDPFVRMHFGPAVPADFQKAVGFFQLARAEFTAVEWLAGIAMWGILRSGVWTYHQLYGLLNEKRNGRRHELRFAPFLQRAIETAPSRGVTSTQLYESYRQSVQRQLAA